MAREHTGGVLSLAALLALAGAAVGQEITAAYTTPALDRWMYPFNGTPGTRGVAPTFGALGVAGFDNRDSQVIIGWDTAGQVTPGLGAGQYQARSARVTVEIGRDLAFVYDPTFDALETYFDAADPAFVADADDGRPLEIFAVGYRGEFDDGGTPVPWDASTFEETSPFTTLTGMPGQFDRLRIAYAAVFDGAGAAVDASNNVRDSRIVPTDPFIPFEVKPLGLGATTTVAAGASVPIGTTFTFDLDLSDPNHRAYLASGLDAGRINLTIATLHPVTGPGDVATPAFSMKEDIFGTPARLDLTVCLGAAADLDCNGAVDVFDLLDYLGDWFAGNADLNGDGVTDVFDLLAYLSDWFGG